MAEPRFETELERELYRALAVTSGYLSALSGTVVDEHQMVSFHSPNEHFGTATLGEVLDMADAALGSAKSHEGNDTNAD